MVSLSRRITSAQQFAIYFSYTFFGSIQSFLNLWNMLLFFISLRLALKEILKYYKHYTARPETLGWTKNHLPILEKTCILINHICQVNHISMNFCLGKKCINNNHCWFYYKQNILWMNISQKVEMHKNCATSFSSKHFTMVSDH